MTGRCWTSTQHPETGAPRPVDTARGVTPAGQERAGVLGERLARPAVAGLGIVDVPHVRQASDEFSHEVRRVGRVPAAGDDEGRPGDIGESITRVVDLVGVGVDAQGSQVPGSTADVRPEEP